ncbi:hypothetical protein ASPZODRAFT_132583 [Penicilliopsis zonata CBS 506.65]|uniref:AB hydrolase-1 domain-containing protein n=1 Tax=Penicilliopsis zonata CBS 506.65 TaxID=1073090 RepID=A0A1L9SHB2_9EURO|nr:hypothetical protein ASPZODRAFT_132583 [Penicilliopsis zonata CBS 506.65]OJJ46507.1 hypothetical protein ASPZODRAFT_132583 [Penicilliopsis zonata CBS 506.65]
MSMSMSTSMFTVLPRPGSTPLDESFPALSAPSESCFTTTFGTLLPAATYLETPSGRAAYYSLPPRASNSPSERISRVLFVHGVQTPAIGLQPLANAVSSRFPHAHCVLFDLWGHGLTETPVAVHRAELFHELILALLNDLGWSSAHFIGYSFGGSTTATFAAAHPDRVSSMVLIAPAGLLRASDFTEQQQRYLKGGPGVEDAARDWIFEFLEGGRLVVPDAWRERVKRGEVVAEAVREWELREHKGHIPSVVAIFRDGGVLDQHAGFAKAAASGIPCLCVLGETDDICTVDDLHQVGMHNIDVISDVGHGVVRQRVSEVAHLIEKFWRD